MVTIHVHTRDRTIWNKDQVLLELAKSMSQNLPVTLDLNNEGPSAEDIGLYELIYSCAKHFDYDISNCTINTSNVLETHSQIKIKFNSFVHLLTRELNKKYPHGLDKTHIANHFGRFVGKSNAPRLILSEYLNRQWPDKTVATYHYKHNDNYHLDNIGLELILREYGIRDVSPYARFLAECPKTINNLNFKFNKNHSLDFSSQLHEIEKNSFIDLYQTFFVEVVSESYYNGQTFFITEKTFRPILLKTPFIVQGPTGFLKNLRAVGFKTFDRWWDEGYDEDPPNWSIFEILKVIEFLATKSIDELNAMLLDMSAVLEHNYNLALQLRDNDFKQLFK